LIGIDTKCIRAKKKSSFAWKQSNLENPVFSIRMGLRDYYLVSELTMLYKDHSSVDIRDYYLLLASMLG